MPNGLSGGFNISRAHLRSLLEQYPPTEELAEFAQSEKLDVTAGEMLEALRNYKPWFDTPDDDEVIVQQHYGSWYVILLAPPPPATVENGKLKLTRLWFVVGDESPIFADLVNHHERWLARIADE